MTAYNIETESGIRVALVVTSHPSLAEVVRERDEHYAGEVRVLRRLSEDGEEPTEPVEVPE